MGLSFIVYSKCSVMIIFNFAHPYCSYYRGINENHNRLIQRFLPKETIETTSVAQIEQ